ncbi:MAG: glycosyltransferase family 2 protein, partial [Ignavibacteriaceae bacterium]
MKTNNIIISACIITYNQEKYIEKCIRGAVEQDLNISYEILIGDDCSADKTSEICGYYAKEYPDLIKHFRREKNLGMNGNWIETIKNCKGKYIA